MSSANLRFVNFDFRGTHVSLEAVGAVVAEGEVVTGAFADGSYIRNDEVGKGRDD